jgi:hypothetical protein
MHILTVPTDVVIAHIIVHLDCQAKGRLKSTCRTFNNMFTMVADPRKVRIAKLRHYNPMLELIKHFPKHKKYMKHMIKNINMTPDYVMRVVGSSPELIPHACANPNITMEMVADAIRTNPDNAQRWINFITGNPNFDFSIVEMFPDLDWDWHYLSQNPDLNADIIKRIGVNKSWNWNNLIDSPNITISDVESAGLPIDIRKMVKNFNMTPAEFYKYRDIFNDDSSGLCSEIIDALDVPAYDKVKFYLSHPNIYSDRSGIGIPLKDVIEYPDILKPVRLCLHEKLTDEFVKSNISLFSQDDLKMLIYNKNISTEFAEQFVEDDVLIKIHEHKLTTAQLFESANGKDDIKNVISQPDFDISNFEKHPELFEYNWLLNPNLTIEFILKHQKKINEKHLPHFYRTATLHASRAK